MNIFQKSCLLLLGLFISTYCDAASHRVAQSVLKHMPFVQARPAIPRRQLTLVSLDWTRPKDPPLSLGHASILTNLLSHGVELDQRAWAVNHPSFSVDDVLGFILDRAAPDMDLALGAFVWNEDAIQQIMKTLKDHKYPGRVILGGPQISYVKQGIQRYYPYADVFIRGYAEEALAKLMTSGEQYPLISGVEYAGHPGLGLTATADLEALPSPYLEGVIQPQRFIRWETQRGCPFSCTFCQHKEADPSKKRRSFSAGRLMEEVDWILNSNVRDIAVLDPTFNSGDRYLDILKGLAEGRYQGKISLQCRLEMVKPAFLDLVEAINETGHVVLEFGLQTTRKEEMQIIQRPNGLRKAKKVLAETKTRGIETELSLIFGLPCQTVQSFQDSIDFCKEQGVDRIYGFPLMLLRGTQLYDQKNKLGLKESTDVTFPGIPRAQKDIPHVVSSPSFSFEDWLKMGEMAEALEEYNTRHASL